MTIKELCKKHTTCDVCPYLPVCGDIPEKYDLGTDLEVTKAIIETAKALQPQPKTGHWITVKFRPLTDEEQEEYPDYCYMADCLMPDDGEEILVSTRHGRVEKDECRYDDGYYLDSGYDWQTDIVAWMPLPEAYKDVDEVKKT